MHHSVRRVALDHILQYDAHSVPSHLFLLFFFFNDTATTEIYTLSLHDALPICSRSHRPRSATAVSCCSTRPSPAWTRSDGGRCASGSASSRRAASPCCWRPPTSPSSSSSLHGCS